MTLSDRDQEATVERYSARFEQFGYSPLTLGWDKGKQDLRFDVLTSGCDLTGLSVLDIGCGFGDLNRTLDAKFGTTGTYTGVDLVPGLVDEARRRWPDDRHRFEVGDFLSLDLPDDLDYAIASGVFNHRFEATSNAEFVEAAITRAFEVCRVGLAFDFLSDRVDYRHEHTHHSSPMEILEIAYGLTRNVVLRNDYMPFEFAVFLRKDDSFDPSDTVFHAYKRDRQAQEAHPR